MMYPLVEQLAAEGVRVTTTCRLLGFSTQAFYQWRARPCSDRDWDDAHLVNEMLGIHDDDPEFGYRFISDELERHGHVVSENRVHRYSIADRMTSALAVAAIRNAALRRDCVGVTVHTDRGGQFRSRAFVSTLNELGMVGSMGRVGAAGDNAAAESFFSLLQKNVLNRQRWATRDDLRVAIIIWIERTYHRRRKQRGLGRLTPIEYETLHQPAAHAA